MPTRSRKGAFLCSIAPIVFYCIVLLACQGKRSFDRMCLQTHLAVDAFPRIVQRDTPFPIDVPLRFFSAQMVIQTRAMLQAAEEKQERGLTDSLPRR